MRAGVHYTALLGHMSCTPPAATVVKQQLCIMLFHAVACVKYSCSGTQYWCSYNPLHLLLRIWAHSCLAYGQFVLLRAGMLACLASCACGHACLQDELALAVTIAKSMCCCSLSAKHSFHHTSVKDTEL